jgi:hypothetical protein
VRRARAQQAAMPVIGFLYSRSRTDIPDRLAAFHNGLGETGFVEGQNKTRPPVQRQYVSFHQLRTFSEARSSSVQPPVFQNRGAWAGAAGKATAAGTQQGGGRA